MLRVACRPKWLGLLALALALISAFVWLGMWQWGVAHNTGQSEAIRAEAARPAAPLSQIIAPHQAFPPDASSRRITTTGTYADGQVVVADRRLDGRPGYWVITPLTVTDGGGTIAVLRGFVTDPAALPAPPSGVIDLAGTLAPSESPSTATVPVGQLGSVDLSVLVNRWPGDLYNAFIFATAETVVGAPVTLPATLTRVPPPAPIPEGLALRNAAYAIQWFCFAGFALFMWWRMVRGEHAMEQALAAAEAGDQPDDEALPDVGEDERHEHRADSTA